MKLISETVYGEVLKDASIQLSKSLHLESHCNVIVFLQSKGVLTPSDCEHLEKQKTGKPGLLIDILRRKPETMFQSFLEALEEEYDWIVEDLNHRIDVKNELKAKSEGKKMDASTCESPSVGKNKGQTETRSIADSGNVSMAKSQGGMSGPTDAKKKNNRKRGGRNKKNKNQTANPQNSHQPQGQGQRQGNNNGSNRDRNDTLPSDDTGYGDSSEIFKERFTERWVEDQSHVGNTVRYVNDAPECGSVFVQDHMSMQDKVMVYDPELASQHAKDYYRKRFPNPQSYGDPRGMYRPMNPGCCGPSRNDFQSQYPRGQVPYQELDYRPPPQERNRPLGPYVDQYQDSYDGAELHSRGTVTPPAVRRRAIRPKSKEVEAEASEEVEAEAKSKRILKVISEEEKHSIKTSYKIKIILGGDPGVGKSSLLKGYYREGKEPRLEDQSTIGVDMPHQVYLMNGTHFSVTFFDVPGHTNKRNIFTSYFKGCHGAIMVYDINKRSSIESLDEWLTAVEKNMTADWLFPVTIVGNKTDLKVHEDTLKLNQQELDKLQEKYADVFNIMFTSTSAKEFKNVIPAFEGIVIRIAEDRTIQDSLKSENCSITLPSHRKKTKAQENTSRRNVCC